MIGTSDSSICGLEKIFGSVDESVTNGSYIGYEVLENTSAINRKNNEK